MTQYTEEQLDAMVKMNSTFSYMAGIRIGLLVLERALGEVHKETISLRLIYNEAHRKHAEAVDNFHSTGGFDVCMKRISEMIKT